jgi:ribonuclease III
VSTSALENLLSYAFSDCALLSRALTHSSLSEQHNERLEYLGDSVLNCAIATLLYERYPKVDEGTLSRMRSNLVKQQTLFEIATFLGIGQALKLGETEVATGGAKRPSILADAFEAVLGAIYLDGSFEAAVQVVKRIFTPILEKIDPRSLGKDAKTMLQEYLQGRKIPVPTYTTLDKAGRTAADRLSVECAVPSLNRTTSGSGENRKAAEQEAARKMLEEITHGDIPAELLDSGVDEGRQTRKSIGRELNRLSRQVSMSGRP